ncbi:hypothetical protein BX666DRAFT_1902030 [Dichotomocladium elegans]|nr:hypothetical protein BX666DRAFT_1902030 [Dichotomocladium elegans]
MSLVKIYGNLTTIQSASAVVFSAFAFVHGSQIAVATIGGPDMANRWLLLGRPFYQDEHMEGIIVTGAATVHVLAGIAKAGIRRYWNQKKATGTQNDVPSTQAVPYHHAAGYLLIPVAWLHYDLVRTLPVRYFGDSSLLDFGHIAWGLQNWPIFTYTVHGILVGAASYHIIGGLSTAYQRTCRRKGAGTSSLGLWKRRAGTATAIGLILLSGLFVIGHQTKKIPLRFEYASIYNMLIPSRS